MSDNTQEDMLPQTNCGHRQRFPARAQTRREKSRCQENRRQENRCQKSREKNRRPGTGRDRCDSPSQLQRKKRVRAKKAVEAPAPTAEPVRSEPAPQESAPAHPQATGASGTQTLRPGSRRRPARRPRNHRRCLRGTHPDTSSRKPARRPRRQ